MADKTLAAALGRKTVDFVDCDGTPHKAPMLTVRDVADLEQEFEATPGGWLGAVRTAGGTGSILWHSLRKEGLAKADILAGKWRWTRAEVNEMFAGGNFEVFLQVVVAILEASGFSVNRDGRPTQEPAAGAATQPAQTGEQSSPTHAPAA